MRLDQKFPKERRIRKSSEYKIVFNDGEKYISRCFVLYIKKRAIPPSRFGVIASRKVGGSVKRNRLKRQAREIFRRQISKDECLDIVFVSRKAMLQASYKKIEEEFISIINAYYKKQRRTV